MATAAASPSAPRSPDWEILVSHHLPHRYARTFALPGRGRKIHVCARCTGQVTGLVAFVVVYLLRADLPVLLFVPTTQLVFAVAPLPAAIDWLTQSGGTRESSNPVRLITGACLGLAFADAFALLLTEDWLLLAGSVIVFALYIATILSVLKVSGAWRRVVDEHFPGVVPRA